LTKEATNLSDCIRKPNLKASLFMKKETRSYLLLFRYFKWQCDNSNDNRISNELSMWRKLCDFSHKNKRKGHKTLFSHDFTQLRLIYKSLYSFPFLFFYFSLFWRNQRTFSLFIFDYFFHLNFNKNLKFNLVLFILNLILQFKKSKYS